MAGYSDLAVRDGARPFITDEHRTYTYGEVAAMVRERATRLAVSKDAVMAVAPDNTIESLVSCLAVWEAGGVLQLINSRLTPSEVAPQLARTGAALTGHNRLSGLATPPASLPDAHRGEERALIVATSGTGGRARLVELTWANLLASAEASRQHLRHLPEDRWLAVLPLFHVGGFSIVVRSLLVGGEVVLRRSFDPSLTAEDLHGVTLASLVGAMLPRILAADPGPYGGLRAVLVGGGPTAQTVLDDAVVAGIPVLSTYGMTETASQIATAPLGDGARRRTLAVPGAEIRVDSSGEIEVRGPMVSRRYVGEPLRGADEWFRTGDLGTIDADGYLRVTGRRDNLIISGGENILPSEVEAAFERVEGVHAVAVFGVPHPDWGQQVAAAVVADMPLSLIEAAVRGHLADYKLPKRWLEVGELPRDELGKVDRYALKLMLEDANGG